MVRSMVLRAHHRWPMSERDLEPGTLILDLGTGDSPMKLGTNRVADEQPLQAQMFASSH